MEERITRIQKMEQCFDLLQQAASADPASLWEIPVLREQWEALIQYYEGGLWRQDYEADEKGILPSDLKRGVLSQDAVWLFLERMQEYEEER